MNPTYREEADQLDAAILTAIERWHKHDLPLSDEQFNELALRVFAFQLHYNSPYAQFCESKGYTRDRLPSSWEEIPPVPSAAFKEATFSTFYPHNVGLVFETSGTTQGLPGRHYMESGKLYDAAALAAFDRYLLPDHAPLRYLNLVPNPADAPHSSLGYMMKLVSDRRGDGATGWFLDNGELHVDAFIAEIEAAIYHDRPICIATTAFALVHLLDALQERRRYFALPTGSRVMETGGFKGRSRYVERHELYERTAQRFGATLGTIVAEYGMTELTSQYYDDVFLRQVLESATEPRYKHCGPWMRARVVGPDGKTLPRGSVGTLVHVDLANRSSVVAIETEDLGVQFEDGLVLMGREAGASLRGCSLSAEDLVAR